jgi:putative endonuclease
MVKKAYWIYMLRCGNGSLYTGYTNDLEKRFNSHIKGTASKYTRAFKPVSIAQSWEIKGGKSEAMQFEHRIKRLSRAEKERIIQSPDLIYDLLR